MWLGSQRDVGQGTGRGGTADRLTVRVGRARIGCPPSPPLSLCVVLPPTERTRAARMGLGIRWDFRSYDED